MNFITEPLSNTNVYSDKLSIVKSKKKLKRQIFLRLCIFHENGLNVSSKTHQKAGSASAAHDLQSRYWSNEHR